MTANKRTPTEGETLLLRVLAEIREALGVGDKPMLADLPSILRERLADHNDALGVAYSNGAASQRENDRAEIARLRRVVVAYVNMEELVLQVKPKGKSKVTPPICLHWFVDCEDAKAELNAALLDSGVPIPEELRKDLEAEKG